MGVVLGVLAFIIIYKINKILVYFFLYLLIILLNASMRFSGAGSGDM